MRRFFSKPLLIALLWACVVTPVFAQNSAETNPAPSPNDLQELSRLLADPSIQQWLENAALKNNGLKNGELDTARSVRDQFEAIMSTTRLRLAEIREAAQLLPGAPNTISQIWQAHINASETLRTITYTLTFLFIGAGLEWLFWQFFGTMLTRVEFVKFDTLRQRINSALTRILIITGALAVFALGTIGTFLAFSWAPIVHHIVLNFLISIILVRAIFAIAKFVLAPRVPALRFVPLSSGPAKRLYFWVALSASISAFAILISDTFAYLARLPGAPPSAGSAALSISIVALLIISSLLLLAVWRMNKSATKRRLEMPLDMPVKSAIMPSFLSVLIVASALLWLLGAREFMWTLIILALIIPATTLVSRLISHLFDQAEGENQREHEAVTEDTDDETSQEEDEDSESRFDLYRPITIRLSRFIMVIGALIALGSVWGASILSLSSDSLSGKIFAIAVDVTVALLIADLIWVWAKTAIDRKMASFGNLVSAGGEGGGAAGPEARMATLLPILRKILMITIFMMVSLSVLSSLGINIGPILAGAGVAGIAIGFGAQALVRDIVSGIFFLLDDAFRVGEYIETGTLRGTVESMSLRSLRVRHHLGAIHTIPFGELKSLTNFSRDWVIMKLQFRVPFDTDIQLVKRLIKKVNAEMQANEAYGHHMLQPLKSQGVRRMEEFNMVIGVKFMASPGEQWLIRRDAYQKIRDIFTANGIDFAQRNVEVKVVSDQPITPEIEKAVAAVAQEATENKLPPPPPKDEP